MTKPRLIEPYNYPHHRDNGAGEIRYFVRFQVTFEDETQQILTFETTKDYENAITYTLEDYSFPSDLPVLCQEGSWQAIFFKVWREDGCPNCVADASYELHEEDGVYRCESTGGNNREQILYARHPSWLSDDSSDSSSSSQKHDSSLCPSWLIRFLPEITGGLLVLAGVALLVMSTGTVPMAAGLGLLLAGAGIFAAGRLGCIRSQDEDLADNLSVTMS